MKFFLWVTFNFVLYSFIGWLIEEAYAYIIKGSFKKEGFLKSPFKPMYGFAMTILVAFNRISNPNIFIMATLCFIVPSIIEYISGDLLKRSFNKVYWDYSNLTYNLNGLVSLRFSFYWMILCLIGVYYFQPIVDIVYYSFYSMWSIISLASTILMIVDLGLTIKEESKLHTNRI
ncbi:putative ABC transporter permease [Clostridium chauvoei]|uniref:ABC transporter permease n=2 Tax=Clostridium chauvoei TaxID=46867 RepID=A0ABD4RG65_9CLOT|nr:putative ABC transporter permease [Clostridium chauvoei]ATD55610.1 hypothetical protein BTM20_10330 [Clostridium chauvoei]ATD56714.1 hypothetical protein BTM21_02695 [Clostridium chauvoei]MBX7280155.1 putative ABC transporter permease [Clostridium chauvoei]MBX7282639.1 putative ABC transporter permease [Clostridium chauvoei]MBX7285046.1 putative ABC transporter permease [Clostridium chauvoei]